MKLVHLALVSFAIVALGCNSDSAKKAAPRPAGFAGDEPSSSAKDAAVFLRGGGVDGDVVHVDVVARGVDRSIQGTAFRLRWDPAKLAFASAHGGRAWSSQALLLAKEGMPGELVVAWTEKGAAAGVSAVAETVLGTLDFAPKTNDGADLEFRTDRSTLHDANGVAIDVAWRGGHVAGH